MSDDIAKALRELDPDSTDFPTAVGEVMDALRGVPVGERPFAAYVREEATDFLEHQGHG